MTVLDESGFIVSTTIDPQSIGRLRLVGIGIFDLLPPKDAVYCLSVAIDAAVNHDVRIGRTWLINTPVIAAVRWLPGPRQYLIHSAINCPKRKKSDLALIMMAETG